MLHSYRWDLHKGLERNRKAAKSDQSEPYDRMGRSIILQQRGPPAGTVRTCQATHAGRRWGVGHLHLHLTSRLLFSVHTFTPNNASTPARALAYGTGVPSLISQRLRHWALAVIAATSFRLLVEIFHFQQAASVRR